jgi:hypothetical protein
MLMLIFSSCIGKMTIVSRKRHSTQDAGQESDAKIERNIVMSEKPRKLKKTDDGPFKKYSKKTKAAGK